MAHTSHEPSLSEARLQDDVKHPSCVNGLHSKHTEGKIIQNRTFFMNMAEPASPD